MTDFAPLNGQQNAIREFCTAAKALQDATDASKASAKAIRERQKESRERLMDALRRLDGGCAEVCLPCGQVGYARLVAKKGGQKRLTAVSFGEAIRTLTPKDISEGCSAAVITRAAMEKMRGDAREDVVITKTQPPQLQVARLPPTSSAGAAYEQARQELREANAAKKEACAPHKDRCERSREQVLAHLKSHDPTKMQQHVRMSQGSEDRAYVLKAHPKAARASRGDTVREAEETVAAALGKQRAMSSASDVLVYLQSDSVLSFVNEHLHERLERLKKDMINRSPLEVKFAPSKA